MPPVCRILSVHCRYSALQWFGCWRCTSWQHLKVISEWALTCDSAHSLRLGSSTLLRNQVASTSTWYPTQSHYPETGPNSPCLIMQSARLESDKYYILSYWLDSTMVWILISPDFPKWETDVQLIHASYLVSVLVPGHVPFLYSWPGLSPSNMTLWADGSGMV